MNPPRFSKVSNLNNIKYNSNILRTYFLITPKTCLSCVFHIPLDDISGGWTQTVQLTPHSRKQALFWKQPSPSCAARDIPRVCGRSLPGGAHCVPALVVEVLYSRGEGNYFPSTHSELTPWIGQWRHLVTNWILLNVKYTSSILFFFFN